MFCYNRLRLERNDSNAEDPSVSGGFDLEDDSGFYIGLWAANVLAAADAPSTDTGSLELDGYLGYAGSFNDNAGYDVGYIAYTYPGVSAWDFEETYIPLIFMAHMCHMRLEWELT